MLLVLILSVVFIPSMSYALTDKEEKLHDLCQQYEEKFDFHRKHYSKSLPLGCKHFVFTWHRQPLISINPATGEPNPQVKVFATVSLTGVFVNQELSVTDSNPEEFLKGMFLALYPLVSGVYVSDNAPNAGTLSKIGGSILDFGGWMTNQDTGAYIVNKDNGIRVFENSFKCDCSECANLLARFINTYISLVK